MKDRDQALLAREVSEAYEIGWRNGRKYSYERGLRCILKAGTVLGVVTALICAASALDKNSGNELVQSVNRSSYNVPVTPANNLETQIVPASSVTKIR